jgi:hypothetical protein
VVAVEEIDRDAPGRPDGVLHRHVQLAARVAQCRLPVADVARCDVEIALLLGESARVRRGVASAMSRRAEGILCDKGGGFRLEPLSAQMRDARTHVAQRDREIDDPLVLTHERPPRFDYEYAAVGELNLLGGISGAGARKHWAQPREQRPLGDPGAAA